MTEDDLKQPSNNDAAQAAELLGPEAASLTSQRAKTIFAVNFFQMQLEHVHTFEALWDLVMLYSSVFGYDKMFYHHFLPAGIETLKEPYLVLRSKADNNAMSADILIAAQSIIRASRKKVICVSPTLVQPIAFNMWIKALEELGVNVKPLRSFIDREISFGHIFPVFGAKNCNGYLFFDFQDGISTSSQRSLHWLCQSAHTKFCQLKRKQEKKRAISLSQREKQILFWVARGKSNSVIAEIIGISSHTVNGYLRKIYLKTGCTDRTTAAIKAINEELIV